MIDPTRVSLVVALSTIALSTGLALATGCSSSDSSGDETGDGAGGSGGGSTTGGSGAVGSDASVSSTGSAEQDGSSGTPGSGGDASSSGGGGDASTADGGPAPDAAIAAGAPSAVGALEETSQGASSISIRWTAATPGKNAVAHYQIYRNGSKLATTTSLTYTDTTASGATTPGYGPEPANPATTYTYNVTAVDSAGLEGPQASQFTAWMYTKGTAFWGGQDYDAPDVTANYADTAGAPADGTKDISITMNGSDKWWQPYSGSPFLTTDPNVWCMEIGAFHYLTIDLKPTKANQTWQINIISRLPPGDVFNSAQVDLPGTFGPSPEVGKWATYKIPFLPASGSADGSSLEVGYGKFTGSISGTTLTVTGDISGLNVQPGSWLTGAGLAADTYITGPQQASGGAGQYTIAPSQNVASTTISAQRTNMYKVSLIDLTSDPQNVYYADNIGFTTN